MMMFTLNLNAQVAYPIPHSNASWGQFLGTGWVFGPGFSGNTHFFTSEGYATIDSVQYILIQGTSPNSYIRQDSTGKVWFYSPNDSTEKLTYDFNAGPGDTVMVWNGWEGIALQGYVEIVVMNVDTVLLNNGETRRRLYINTYDHSGGLTTWIEGIGSSWGLPYPAFAEIIDHNSWLTCFTHNDTIKFGDVCNLVLSTKNIQSYHAAQLYPNPNNGIFNIQLPKRHRSQFGAGFGGEPDLIVQNIHGQILYQRDVETTNGSVEVALNNIPNGLYTITVRSDDSIYNAKLLINK